MTVVMVAVKAMSKGGVENQKDIGEWASREQQPEVRSRIRE
jgi:hypothetical protein